MLIEDLIKTKSLEQLLLLLLLLMMLLLLLFSLLNVFIIQVS